MILIFGGLGWIGQKVVTLLTERSITFTVSQVRVDNLDDVMAEIKKINPTHIMCFIGRTHGSIGEKYFPTIDYLEQKGKLRENVNDNLFCPMALAILCQRLKIHLTYLGTGCIFNYADSEEFTEEDKPNFFGSSYSVVKGYTDRLMHLFPDTVLNVRIRMPISSDKSPRNFIMKIIKYEKICSMPNSMTVLEDLLPVMIDMAMHNQTGTINLVNPGLITHAEILDMYKEIIDPTFNYQLFSYDEQMKVIACDRSNNALSTEKLSSLYSIPNIKDSVRATLTRFKNL